MPMHRTGFVFDERYLRHDTGAQSTARMRNGSFETSPEGHPSSTVITRRIKEFLDGSGLTAMMHPIPARAASEDELAVYHTREYIAGIRAHVEGGPMKGAWGEIESDTPLSPGSFEAAAYAAGGSISGVQAIMQGQVRNAYALLRPPGHHAMSNRAIGFCIFNNAVVAAHYARRASGLERVMIVDWDVHHGNGTQDAFYADPGVLFVSLHQHNWYPRLSGELEQVGSGAGAGYTVNIPLPGWHRRPGLPGRLRAAGNTYRAAIPPATDHRLRRAGCELARSARPEHADDGRFPHHIRPHTRSGGGNLRWAAAHAPGGRLQPGVCTILYRCRRRTPARRRSRPRRSLCRLI